MTSQRFGVIQGSTGTFGGTYSAECLFSQNTPLGHPPLRHGGGSRPAQDGKYIQAFTDNCGERVSAPKNPSPDRREFLTHVATAALVAGAACAAPLAAESLPASRSRASKGAPFDDSWTRRVAAAKHRAVLDSPGIEDGLALMHATYFIQGFREQLDVGASDILAVVVLRHQGTVIALTDSIWERYAIGERYKVKDPATGKDALRNPFLRVSKDDTNALVPPEASLEGLLASGAVLLACNKAAMRLAGQVAQKYNRNADEVRAEFRDGIVPGVLLQPSGIYATLRAQEVGCAFIKST